MKRTVTIMMATILVCAVFAACGAEAPPADTAPSLAEEESAADADFAPEPEEEADESEESATPAPEPEPPEPIHADQIADGTYTIGVSSSSSMFRVVDAQLTVAGEEMHAVLTLSGTGYEKLYMGTEEQALTDTDDASIYFVEDSEGAYTYAVPVEALDVGIDVAAWSFRRQRWYDRTLVFQSGLIPTDALVTEETA